ncbi:MAG: asparagine synthase-related protein [Actinomycetota bacterium]|nr:asparagine synthase-related protein [Actinomycetota bacterium]
MHPRGVVGRTGSEAWASGLNPAGLTELEVASGDVVARGATPPAGPAATSSSPLAALEAEAVGLLSDGPCLVAFSGGRDSSAVLAVLVHVARREGLPEPAAVTARWPGDANSDEDAWQDHVIGQLKVEDWRIIEPGDDLDLLGSVATTALRRHGLIWPPAIYAIAPLLEEAAGGVLVTGEGGDELFGEWPYGDARLRWADRERPCRSDVMRLAAGCVPLALRTALVGRRQRPYQSWLTPSALRAFHQGQARDLALDYRPWPSYLTATPARRSARLMLRSASALASSAGARYGAPLLSASFAEALGRAGGPLGFGDRTAVMRTVFGELLDDRILTRVSKAHFSGVFWGPAGRAFAERWDGTGLPTDLVDVEALRRAWLAPLPVAGAALALHAAWLASRIPSSHP